MPLIGALLAVLIAAAVKWTLDQIEAQLKHQVGESLRTVVATTREGIELWADAIEAEVVVLVDTPDLVAAVQDALEHPSPRTATPAPIQRLRQAMNPAFTEYRFTGFAIINPEGALIAGSNPGRFAEADLTRTDAVMGAMTGAIAIRLFVDGDGSAVSLVAAPVRDRSGQLIAALVLFLDPTPGLTAITRLGRPGSTGETYIFARDGHIVTGSRFRRAQGGVVAVQTSPELGGESRGPRISDPGRLFTMMTTSFYPEIGVDVAGYFDYRGIPVLGAWSWLDRLAIGIAAEVDRDEALSSFRTIRMLTLSLLTAIGMSLLGLLVLLVSRDRIRASHYALARAAEARREVLGMVSHDLRSPLHHVLLSADVIAAAPDRETVDKAADAIRRTGRRMERLVADLLDVFEIGEGRLRIDEKPCAVASLLAEAREDFVDEANSRGIHLIADWPSDIGSVLADPERVSQVLGNLITNAFKFTPRGGTVSLGAAPLGDEVRFMVHDTGPGIPEDQLPRVFDQFFRASTTSTQAGRGLGLYIAKALVEWQGGRIWVESGKDGGSTFFFTMPS